ncbi:hypothetical protein ACJJTC_019610 [Scirpophaga incertulas]
MAVSAVGAPVERNVAKSFLSHLPCNPQYREWSTQQDLTRNQKRRVRFDLDNIIVYPAPESRSPSPFRFTAQQNASQSQQRHVNFDLRNTSDTPAPGPSSLSYARANAQIRRSCSESIFPQLQNSLTSANIGGYTAQQNASQSQQPYLNFNLRNTSDALAPGRSSQGYAPFSVNTQIRRACSESIFPQQQSHVTFANTGAQQNASQSVQRHVSFDLRNTSDASAAGSSPDCYASYCADAQFGHSRSPRKFLYQQGFVTAVNIRRFTALQNASQCLPRYVNFNLRNTSDGLALGPSSQSYAPLSVDTQIYQSHSRGIFQQQQSFVVSPNLHVAVRDEPVASWQHRRGHTWPAPAGESRSDTQRTNDFDENLIEQGQVTSTAKGAALAVGSAAASSNKYMSNNATYETVPEEKADASNAVAIVWEKRNASPRHYTSLGQFNESLLSSTVCSKCMCMVGLPVSKCRGGHVVCGKCHIGCERCSSRLAICPVCKDDIMIIYNHAGEKVRATAHFPCWYNCQGPVLLREVKSCLGHVYDCPDRTYRCPMQYCPRHFDQRLDYVQLQKHLADEHPWNILRGRRHQIIVWLHKSQSDLWVVEMLEGMFTLRRDVHLATGMITVLVSYIGPKHLDRIFNYTVTIKGKRVARLFSQKLVHHRSVLDDFDCLEDRPTRKDYFRLDIQSAMNYLRIYDNKVSAKERPYLILDVNIKSNKYICAVSEYHPSGTDGLCDLLAPRRSNSTPVARYAWKMRCHVSVGRLSGLLPRNLQMNVIWRCCTRVIEVCPLPLALSESLLEWYLVVSFPCILFANVQSKYA